MLSNAQTRGLRWLDAQGGEGVVDQYGRVLATGELNGTDSSTWLRLFTMDLIESAGKYRLRITPAGREALRQANETGRE